TVLRLVLNMRGRDRDAASLLLRRSVNLVISLEVAKILRDRGRQRRLAMVNVTNRANVHMRLVALEFTFGHLFFLEAWNRFVSKAARLAAKPAKDKPAMDGARLRGSAWLQRSAAGSDHAEMGMPRKTASANAAEIRRPEWRTDRLRVSTSSRSR